MRVPFIVAASVAVTILSGCTSHQPNPSKQAVVSPGQTSPATPHPLPSLPSNVQGTVLLRQVGGAGTYTLTTKPAKAGKLTVEAACSGASADLMGLTVRSAAGKSLFRTSGTPCVGVVRNVGLTVPASAAGYIVKLDVPTGSRYAVLVTQAG